MKKEVDHLFYEITANPPHEGHQTALEIAWQALRPSDTILVIPWTHVWKPSNELAPFELRRMMAQKQFSRVAKIIDANGGSFSIYDLPTHLRKGVETYEIVEQFASEFSGQIGYLIGADNLTRFHLRKRWEHILEKAKVVVVPRDNIDYEGTLEATHSDVLDYVNASRILLVRPKTQIPSYALEASSSAVKQKLNEETIIELRDIIVERINKENRKLNREEIIELVYSYIRFAEITTQLPEIDSEVFAMMITWRIFSLLGL